MTRVLHAGFHKTGSSFLQNAFFPKLKNVLFIRKLDLATVRTLSSQDESILFSNEAACGYPYPITEEFSTARLESTLEITKCEKVLLVKREFNSWVLSLYFQTLNEQHFWSLQEFISQNRQNLLTWKNAPEAIAQMCKERGTDLLVIDQSDLYKKQANTLQRISFFINGSNYDPADIISQERHNVSRYGMCTIKIYRILNRVLKNKIGFALGRKIRRLPRKLIQGRIGAMLDRVSPAHLASTNIEKLMK